MKKSQGIFIIFIFIALLAALGCTDPANPTPTPPPGATEPPSKDSPGTVWIDNKTTIYADDEFQLKVYVNTGAQEIAAYGINLVFDPAMLTVNTTIGEKGVQAGVDGFVAAVNPNVAGTIQVSGFETSPKPAGTALHLFSVNFMANGDLGSSAVTVDVKTLTDATYANIGTPAGLGGTVNVLP